MREPPKSDIIYEDIKEAASSEQIFANVEEKSKSDVGRKASDNSDLSNNKKTTLVDVPDSVVQDAMDKVDKKEDEFDVIQEIFPIPLKMFWDNFFADKAQFSLGDFLVE